MTFQEKMDLFFKEYIKTHKYSGYVRVTKQDEMLYEKCIGYANIEHEILITPDSMFTMYSLSKPFCAIAFMKLVEEGKLSLDAHPGKYIPEAKDLDERVTFRNLIRHQSGLADIGVHPKIRNKCLNEDGRLDMRKTVKSLAELPLDYEPGSKVIYSNTGFIISAIAIENVADMPYKEYVEKVIFNGLGAKTAKVDSTGYIVKNRVCGYTAIADEWVNEPCDVEWMLGAGDVIATADDVYCLNKAVKNKLFLKPETWKIILSNTPENSFGLGCMLAEWHGKMRVQHNGGHKGFRTMHIHILDEDMDIIILSNSAVGNPREDISEALYNAYYGGNADIGESFEMDKGYI